MTVAIGIVCKDGIVISCDSQTEFERGAPVKRMNANKIYTLGDNIAIAGAGTVAFVGKAVNLIRAQYDDLKDKRELSVDNLMGSAEGAIADIHKVYDVDRVKYLYGAEATREIVQMILMVGSVEYIKNQQKNHLYLLHKIGFSEPVNDYATIGSGAAYAEYLLSKYYNPNITLEIGKKLAIYTVKEVEKMDPNVGGPVNVVVIDKDGYHELKEEEILKIYEDVRKQDELLCKLTAQSLTGKIKVEELRGLLKE